MVASFQHGIALLWLCSTTLSAIVLADDSPFSSSHAFVHRIFPDCDVEQYYDDSKDGRDTWNRQDMALLLAKTHRQIILPTIPAALTSSDLDSRTSILQRDNDETTSTTTTTWDALLELDPGASRGPGMDTVRMIFTQSDVQADAMGSGWEPGYLWPLPPYVSASDFDTPEEYQHWVAAQADLHNLRPRHPSLNQDPFLQSLFYGDCEECTTAQQSNSNVEQIVYDKTDSSSKARVDNGKTGGRTNNGGSREDGTTGTMISTSDGQLCLCKDDNAIQPPEMAKGQIARALLYMELRYGTQTTASDGLGLHLTDCDNQNTDDAETSTKTPFDTTRMGYFSTLVQWHLEYPPTEEERIRNTKVCELYQGNRNPFVDFPEDSWSLLNFEGVDGEKCSDNGTPITQAEDTEGQQQQQEEEEQQQQQQQQQQEEEEEEEEEKEETSTTPEPVEEGRLDTTAPEPDSNSMTSFCEALEPGDLNFYLVRSGGTGNSQDDSFGLIPMVDLPAGLEVYVTDNAWLGEGYGFDTSEGTYKLIVPHGGIPAFKFFGHGDLLYLGEKWEPVEEGDAFQFSIAYNNDGEDGAGDELFAYCTTDGGGMNKYHVLAALSTTGKEPEEMLPDNLRMNGYGVIILPPTSTRNGDEHEDEDGRVVGYRYSGSAYMSADQYSKALINAKNWSPFVVSLDASSSSANSEATANGIDSHDLSPRSSSTSSFVVGDSLWMSILVTIAMVVGRNLP